MHCFTRSRLFANPGVGAPDELDRGPLATRAVAIPCSLRAAARPRRPSFRSAQASAAAISDCALRPPSSCPVLGRSEGVLVHSLMSASRPQASGSRRTGLAAMGRM
jgi:hypothetical protein